MDAEHYLLLDTVKNGGDTELVTTHLRKSGKLSKSVLAQRLASNQIQIISIKATV